LYEAVRVRPILGLNRARVAELVRGHPSPSVGVAAPASLDGDSWTVPTVRFSGVVDVQVVAGPAGAVRRRRLRMLAAGCCGCCQPQLTLTSRRIVGAIRLAARKQPPAETATGVVGVGHTGVVCCGFDGRAVAMAALAVVLAVALGALAGIHAGAARGLCQSPGQPTLRACR
jgi:hypothetical protein